MNINILITNHNLMVYCDEIYIVVLIIIDYMLASNIIDIDALYKKLARRVSGQEESVSQRT